MERECQPRWFFRWIYPRVFAKALCPDEARALFERSPFGAPRAERLLMDGCLWLFEARKAERPSA